jgi:short-subunit dehydrogenase
MKCTLITGASAGMGKEMAMICASLGRNVLLISLPNENVSKTALDISTKYSVKTDYFECDLTLIDTPEKIYKWTIEKGYQVNFLINNAGIGHVGMFERQTFRHINLMMDLNMKAGTLLIHFFLEELKKNGPSHILNTSSMIANMPLPSKALYASTKVYLKYLSLALREEFSPHNISVSVLQPGATPTTEIVKFQIENGGLMSRISATSVEFVAKEAIVKTLKGKAIIIPGFKNRLSLFLVSMIPWPIRRILLRNQGRKMSHL